LRLDVFEELDMADSNSLVLLPPRPTAEAAKHSSSSRAAKPSNPGSFGKKLEKAKAQKVLAVVKKVVPDAVPKSKLAPVAVVKKTVDDEAENDESATSETPKELKQDEEPTAEVAEVDPSKDEHQAAAPLVVAEQEVAAHAVEKKPVKAPKATVKQGPQDGAPGPIGIHPHEPTVAKAASDSSPESAASQADASSQKAAVTPVGADADGGDPTDSDALGDGEFGTGKVVGAGAGGGKNAAAAKPSPDAADATQDPAAAAASVIASADVDGSGDSGSGETQPVLKLDAHPADVSTNDLGAVNSALAGGGTTAIAGKASVSAAATPAARFVEENHPKIVTAIAGQLQPHGGTMQMRLDPPELGALQVTVHLKDGVMTASFETSNDEATKLLSHSLGTLKSSLEAAGVNVDKIHVERAPQRDSANDSESDGKQGPQDQQRQAQQDQQRREMVQRMWRKLAGGADPLDLVA
jgi:flagellar hook-length control protein FliK